MTVLFVGDWLKPIDGLTILNFRGSNVRHRGILKASMSVLDYRRNPHRISRSHLVDRSALVLHSLLTIGHDKRLPNSASR